MIIACMITEFGASCRQWYIPVVNGTARNTEVCTQHFLYNLLSEKGPYRLSKVQDAKERLHKLLHGNSITGEQMRANKLKALKAAYICCPSLQ